MARHGFTLLELVIVMVIMTVALAIAIPAVDTLMNPNQVVASIDAVRSQWVEARSRAMEEGRAYRFSVQDNSGKFRIEPDDPDNGDGSEPALTREGDLPEPCLFVTSADALKGASGPGTSDGNWRSVAVFLPDGTVRDDASLIFGRPSEPAVTLRLRALTGSISQDAPGKEATR